MRSFDHKQIMRIARRLLLGDTSSRASMSIEREVQASGGHTIAEREPAPLNFDPKIIDAFRRILKPHGSLETCPACIRLYRGGECRSTEPFTIRRSNIFMTKHKSYAKNYTNFRNQLPYRYLYSAITTCPITVAVVTSMKPVVDVAVDLNLTKANAGPFWQRENIINIARQALSQKVGGVYFVADDMSDEFLLDNSFGILDLRELEIIKEGDAWSQKQVE